MTDQTYPAPNEIETRKGKTYVLVDHGTKFSDLPRIHRTTKAHYARFGFAGCLQLGDGSSRTFYDGQPYTVPDDGKHYYWLELEEALGIVSGTMEVDPIENKNAISERVDAAYTIQSYAPEPTPTPDADDLLPETDAEAEVVAAFDQLSKAVVKAMRLAQSKEGGEE